MGWSIADPGHGIKHQIELAGKVIQFLVSYRQARETRQVGHFVSGNVVFGVIHLHSFSVAFAGDGIKNDSAVTPDAAEGRWQLDGG
jgi:hypothetical protein